MTTALRVLAALDDGHARHVGALHRMPNAPHRSTIHREVRDLAREGYLTSIKSGGLVLYSITDEGRERLSTLRAEALLAIYPEGQVLAVIPDEGRTLFVHGDMVCEAKHIGARIEVREVLGFGEMEYSEDPIATLPPTIPLARVAVEYGKGGAS